MIRIGLTGNAGSGKSTAVKFFLSKGVNAISSDSINSDLRHHCKYLAAALESILQARLSDNNGQINVALLRDILFSSKSKKICAEKLLHPIIMENIDLQVALLPRNIYCIIEIPLLFEANWLAQMDSVLLVTANERSLIAHLTTRCLTEKEAMNILSKQLADRHKFQYSDNIVLNNDSREHFLESLRQLHARFIKD